MAKIKVGVVGASGYVGLELIRLILQHPFLELRALTSREQAGKTLSECHPSLSGLSQLNFSKFEELPSNLDLVFVAVPHGESMGLVAKLFKQGHSALKVIDMGSDFRLPAEKYFNTYALAHLAPDLLEEAVYGVPELFADRIASARLVANPGCFANCINLALAPLARVGLLQGTVQVNAITGSSGSGMQLSKKTHHAERDGSLSAYNVLGHRHVPEIEQAMQLLSSDKLTAKIELVPLSGPFSRGIFATSFVRSTAQASDLQKLFQNYAEENPFIRLRTETPRLIEVRASNFCDISIKLHDQCLVVLSAIDNLVKGAAGNAIQCLNLLFGLPQQSGLLSAPIFP